ncbi:hypothetical protein CPB86DRAFT_425740 [Serendipita vermifera]|nr:hypothetical protein CPB86DRAFT_425740 [Serendipita vermifera]
MRLLRFSDMSLLTRGDLLAIYNKETYVGDYYCEEEECNCFQSIRDKLQYSILSHRWGGDEFTFSHLMMLKGPKGIKTTPPEVKSLTSVIEDLMEGPAPLDGTLLEKLEKLLKHKYTETIHKLLKFRTESIKRDCLYGWLDTVCINKTSSAELDESLRSMYAWYRDCRVCIVHLGDTDHHSEMKSESWFTRGWTLQELLAPKRMAFYCRAWVQITSADNDKLEDKKKLLEKEEEQEGEEENQEEQPNELALWPTISKVTGIPVEDLLDFKPGPFDIGKRLSWISRRRTTVIEDIAYSLIGVFDVTLPIAYGEHEKAWYRLQVELIQSCSDKSVFAWQGQASKWNSMLAAAPSCFAKLPHPLNDVLPLVESDPFVSMTNIGLRMPLLVFQLDKPGIPKAWKLPGATAVAIIAKLPNTGEYLIVVLGKTELPRQYRRLEMLQTRITESQIPKSSELIYIK